MTDQSGSPLGGDFVAHPAEVLAEFRESCPVARVLSPSGQPRWLITREQDVRAGFLDPRLSLRTTPGPKDRPHRALDMSLVCYDPPDHTRIRRLAAPAFAPARIEPYRDRIAALAAELVDALDTPTPTACPAEPMAEPTAGPTVDLMARFAQQFAFQVLCEVLAIPRADQPALRAAVAVLIDRRGHDATAPDEALNHLDSLIRHEIGARLGGSGQDVFSSIVRAWESANGTVSESELVDLLAMLLLAGLDSTAQMLGMCVMGLLSEPGLTARLRAEPELMPRAVDELLRWETPGPFGTARTALEEIQVGDHVIPAGSRVLLAVAAANRDPRCHREPDRLDLDRPNAGRHLSFGLGPHYCLGATLAKLELIEALTALLARWPELRLGCSTAELRWTGGSLHRRLEALPLLLGPTAPAAPTAAPATPTKAEPAGRTVRP